VDAMSFFSRLESRVRAIDSLLCVGLDPHIDDLPTPNADAAYNFCLRLIETTADYTASFKPNIAFFEIYGAEGFSALKNLLDSIPPEIPIILDSKRGDIASTAQAYARATFQMFNADAVTINPYLGRDAVLPFLHDPEKGVFLLCKTSNPGASDLQDMAISEPSNHAGISENISVFEHVAQLAVEWNQFGNLGLVVGSTHPESIARVRAIAPDMWFLAPGVGAQGADLEAALFTGLREDGLGMLIPVSRGISRAENTKKAAGDLRDRINATRENITHKVIQFNIEQPEKFNLADMLLEKGCIKLADDGDEYTLKSGTKSPIYIDLRRLVTFPDLLKKVASAYLLILRRLKFERLAALPYAAIPITTAISLAGGWSMIYPRKEVKQYGTKADIEGEYFPGERVVVIDDLVTTGGSKFEAIDKLTSEGLLVNDVVVLIDRESGAAEALSREGYQMHAIMSLSEMLDHWERTRQLSTGQIKSVREFLRTQKN
jgi:uridine monophosphate synthetase